MSTDRTKVDFNVKRLLFYDVETLFATLRQLSKDNNNCQVLNRRLNVDLFRKGFLRHTITEEHLSGRTSNSFAFHRQ